MRCSRWGLAFLLLLHFVSAAWSQEHARQYIVRDQAKLKVLGVFCGSPGRCDKPCEKWAKWQPDFQFSYEACVANCRKDPNCPQ
jgi:hypothetical protein